MYLFGVVIYFTAYFRALLATREFENDLLLLHDLYNQRKFNESFSNAACKKLEHHLWYLSKELVGLAYLLLTIPIASKYKQAKTQNNSPLQKGPTKKYNYDCKQRLNAEFN